MRVFVLGSGSTGNALLVDDGSTRILVEAGVGPRHAAERLALVGETLAAPGGRCVDAIVVSHEHGDHFGHAGRLAAELGAPVWVHRGIDASGLEGRGLRVACYEAGRPFRVGSIEVSSVRVPHDAPHVALRLEGRGRALGVATDVGRVTPSLVALLASCDAALVEANHCPDMLAFGDYPPMLKRRLAGGLGHLSNVQTAELAGRLRGTRLGRMWLGHLSRSNNTPERARDVVGSAAGRIEVDVLPHGAVCALDVTCTRPHQLAFAFDGPPSFRVAEGR